MSNQEHEVTPQAVAEFTRFLLDALTDKRAGDTTLNELRIMNQIVICHFKGRCCSVTALHRKTGIPVPTVSRVLAGLQYNGWLSERRDPNDGRRRIITLSDDAMDRLSDDLRGMVDWLNAYREHGLPDGTVRA